MRSIWMLGVLAVLLVACTLTRGVLAAPSEAVFAPHFIQQTNKHTTRFVEKAEQLRSKPAEDWTEQDQQYYLSNALWAVYSAVFSYSLLHGELPTDLTQVVNEGLLSVWPGNPYNDWRPLQVTSGTEFSAGDLALQLCPRELYSLGPDGRSEVPLTFELAIFGPDAYFSELFGNAQPGPENTAWASVPDGALYMISGWTEPASAVRAKAAGAAASTGGSHE